MKTFLFTGRATLCGAVTKFLWVVTLLSAVTAHAQIQQAWVVHYNNGITNGTNAALKMTLDSNGNIYVLSVSQNTNYGTGYATIKYAPNGTQQWISCFDSLSVSNAAPAAFALDNSNNVIVTGNAGTVKYDDNGNQLWTAPYAGIAVAVDSIENVYITGYSTGFNTVKLTPSGSNVWQTSYTDVGPTMGEAIVVDSADER